MDKINGVSKGTATFPAASVWGTTNIGSKVVTGTASLTANAYISALRSVETPQGGTW